MCTMKQLVKDVASNGCKNSCSPFNTGNNNLLWIIIVVVLLCSCGGAGDILGGYGGRRRGRGRRGRRRGTGNGLVLGVLLGLLLLGNNNGGRNANTNIINLDTAALEEPDGGGLLDL
jgi:hypothetical protein